MEMRTKQHCKDRLLRKDDTIFRDYIENTTTHGVVRIFRKHSIIRRLFWLVIVLGAMTGCLYNCIERVRFLASGPTSTFTSIRRVRPIPFPAVTICNLNVFTASSLNQTELLEIAEFVLNIDPGEPGQVQECREVINSSQIAMDIMLEDLIYSSSHNLSRFVLNCTFLGRACNLQHDFEPIITGLGLCYMFNGKGRIPMLDTNGTGSSQGLFLLLNIEQDEYVTSPLLDAGVRVVIHPQSEPPQALDQGISVPPGRNAFIGMRQQRIVDNVGKECKRKFDTNQFNYLRDSFNYSAPACLADCLFTAIADSCNCSHVMRSYSPDNPSYAALPGCHFSDVCCIQGVLVSALNCECLASCDSTLYSTFTSYSTLPAEYATDFLEYLLEVIGRRNVQDNIVGLSIYYETLNVESHTSNSAYNSVALLSDIGGQLGLFLGMSIISILEFGTWVLDEIKDRCFCLRCRQKRKENGPSDIEVGEIAVVEEKYSMV